MATLGGWPYLVGMLTPHLGAVVVELEGQHHSSVYMNFLGPINVLWTHLQTRARTLPGKLGSLRGRGSGADLMVLSVGAQG